MHRRSLVLALVLGGCCFAPRPADTSGGPIVSPVIAPPSGACDGHWTGTGVQPGFPPWTLDMNITTPVADRCGTIEYPSLGCGGYLVGCGALANGETSFTEVYDHTSTNCAPAGSIHALCTGTTMTWTWEGEGGPVTTTLTRM